MEDRLVDVCEKLDHLAGRLESSERTSADTARRLDERISDASTVTDDFVGQLEPLKAAVTSATERLEAREGALQAMEHRFHDATTRVDDLVAELSRALAELPDPNSIEPALAARIDEVAERTVSLTEAIDRVEASLREQRRTSASSAADVERLHEELSTVRGQFDDAGEGFSSLVAQQQQLLSEIGARTTALEQSEGNVPRELDDRVMDLRDKLEALAHRLELSTTAVTSTAAMASTTDEEVSALRDYVDKAGARLSALVAEQTRALSALDTRTESLEQADSHVLSSVDERLSTTSDRIDELSSRLDPLVARARDELEGRIEELDARLGSADDDRTETASEVARIAAILEVERAAVRTKLDALAAALEKTPPATEADELGQRIDDLVSRFEALDGERASSQTQFEAIANALASIPQHFSFEQRLDELGRRLDEVEQRGATVTTKVSQPSALLPAALRSLEARLDEVSPGIRESVQEPEAPSTQTTPDDEPETTETVELVDRETAAVVPLRVREP